MAPPPQPFLHDGLRRHASTGRPYVFLGVALMFVLWMFRPGASEPPPEISTGRFEFPKFHFNSDTPTSCSSNELLQRSIMFASSGTAVRDTLRRAKEQGEMKVLVLGGSVSYCRGVDPQTECWPSHIDRFISKDPTFLRLNTTLYNAAKSATPSSYFAYCLHSELSLQFSSILSDQEYVAQTHHLVSANTPTYHDLMAGGGPDLVVLEFGINDVYPLSDTAVERFERLIRRIRSFESRPAIVILEIASLFRSKYTPWVKNPEFLHLPVATFYDVPVLSLKQLLFSSSSSDDDTQQILKRLGYEDGGVQSLFLKDTNHPSPLGHKLVADVLSSYLSHQNCEIATEPNSKVHASEDDTDSNVRNGEEGVGIYSPPSAPSTSSKGVEHLSVTEETCILAATNPTAIISNEGWQPATFGGDKRYLSAQIPGSKVTFEVQVPQRGKGELLVDWLRSRNFDLGDALVWLDNDRAHATKLSSYWSFKGSIGVPQVIFKNLKRGSKTKVSFELLKTDTHKIGFELISVIAV